MKVNTTRNANSAAAASAAATTTDTSGQPSGGYPETGPLPRSALAAALVTTFEGQPQSPGQAQGAPSGEDGQAQPGTTDNPAGQPASGEVQPTAAEAAQAAAVGETQETTQTTEGTQGGPGGEQTETQLQEQVEQAGELEDPELAELPIGIRKRLGKLVGRIAQLEAQLEGKAATAEAAPPAAQQRPAIPGPLDTVTNPAELDERENVTGAALVEIDNLLARLPVNPQYVEQALRKAGINLVDDSGQADYSNEAMLNWLTGTRTGFHQTLRAIPKRRQFLVDYTREHAAAIQHFPWLADKKDERHALMSNFLGQAPGLRNAPNHEYWVACAIERHLELEAKRVKANGNNGRPAPMVAKPKQARPLPNTGSSPAARSVRPDQSQVNAARERVKKEGSREALSAYLQSANFVG